MSGKVHSSKSVWPFLLGINEDQWSEATAQFVKIAASLATLPDRITQASKDLSSWLDRHGPMISNALTFLEDLKNPETLNHYLGLYASEIHKGLSRHGFFVPLSGLTIGSVTKISQLLKDENPLAICGYMCEQLREKRNIEKLRRRWVGNALFKKRQRFLNRGLEAHLRGDFITSIPVLLPHIEGIFLDFFLETGLIAEMPDKFQGNDVLSLLKKATVEKIVFLQTDTIQFRRFVSRKRIYERTPEKEKYLNRGAVLHGVCLTYDKEEWSAQLIYFLDFVCEFTSQAWDLEALPNGGYVIRKRHS